MKPHSPLRSYFDSVSFESVGIILRHLSRRPYIKQWHSYLDPRLVLRTLRIGGTITKVARDEFRYLYLLDSTFDEQKFSGIRVNITEQCGLLKELIIDQGSRLHTLHFVDKNAPFVFEDFLFKKFVVLHELKLGKGHAIIDLELILGVCGATLQELYLEEELCLPRAHVNAIAKHCKKLEKLKLCHRDVCAPLDNIWRAVGSKLRNLIIRPPAVYGDVAKHCPVLKDVSVNTESQFSVKFLCRLGQQLQHIRFYNMGGALYGDNLRRVLTKCSQARVHTSVLPDDVDILRDFGSQLMTIGVLETKLVTSALNSCRNTTKYVQVAAITISSVQSKFLQLFFASTTHLRRLRLKIEIEGFDLPLLDMLAGKLPALEELLYQSEVPLNEMQYQKFIIECSALRLLYLFDFEKECISLSEQCIDSILQLIQLIISHPALTEVLIQQYCETRFSRLIANACVRLRGRRINLIFYGVQYMPTVTVSGFDYWQDHVYGYSKNFFPVEDVGQRYD